ncbi:butyrophilin subfamily 3 member A2-like [Salvelinus alpinus]|uniref:butyrophilin subfamily 3 member A2-like n=1 Tax=Salvelinus alpinus TaxID=8036 RepID=UPI0039FCBF09
MESEPDSLFVTLLLLLHSSQSESEWFEVLGPTDVIVAVAGDDIILPCYLKPNISAEDMTVDWLNLDFIDYHVYSYQNSKTTQDHQIPSYIGRTSLFIEELWRGNTSLKLTRVQGTDEGHYKCFIQSKSWYDDFTIQVLVKAVGSKPVVSIEGHREGGMGLLCESEGWHPQPELVWLDSKGVNLSAGPPETHRDFKGFYRVKQHVIVQETDTNRFTCRVQQSRLNEKMETEIHLPSELFDTTPWRISFIVLCCLGAVTVIGLALTIYCICNQKVVKIFRLKLQREEFSRKLEFFIVKLIVLRKELVVLRKELDEIREEKDVLTERLDDLRKERDMLEGDLIALLIDLDDHTEKFSVLKKESKFRNLCCHNKDLRKERNDHTGRLDDLTGKLKDLTGKLVNLKKELGGITVDHEDLTEKLVPLPEELDVLSGEMSDLTQDQECSSTI